MSHLKLYDPSSVESDNTKVDEPRILPFRSRISSNVSRRRPDIVHRARMLYENRCCSFCGHADVEPLELDDALISRQNHRPVPGTATIVGFHCHHCAAEWPAYVSIEEPA